MRYIPVRDLKKFYHFLLKILLIVYSIDFYFSDICRIYSLQVLYEINPDKNKTITPVNIPDVLNSMGRVNIVPPIIEFTKVNIVLQEGFNP